MRGVLIAGIAGYMAAVCAPALAACSNSEPEPDSAHVATVTGPDKRVFFVQDKAGCPNVSADCRAKAYVTQGDVVLVTISQGDYSCASFTNTRGITTTNWLPTAALTPRAPQTPGPQDWLGRWVRIEAEIKITASDAKGALAVKGDATYGALDPDRVRRGAVNIGELDAVVRPVDARLGFTSTGDATLPYDQGKEDDCRVRMFLFVPYMWVADNRFCGGNNVSFTGLYRRQK